MKIHVQFYGGSDFQRSLAQIPHFLGCSVHSQTSFTPVTTTVYFATELKPYYYNGSHAHCSIPYHRYYNFRKWIGSGTYYPCCAGKLKIRSSSVKSMVRWCQCTFKTPNKTDLPLLILYMTN